MTDGTAASSGHWEGRFTTPPGRERELAETVGNEVYAAVSRRCAACRNCRERPDGRRVSCRLRFAAHRTMAEAAGILSANRNARLLSGGTLVMRDVNEGRLTEGTLVRLLDPPMAASRRAAGGSRSAPARPWPRSWRGRSSPSSIPRARAGRGPAVRNMATVGGNLFAPSPYGDLAVALLALDAQVLLASGYGQPRATPLEEFFASRDRGNPGLVAAVSFNRPGNPGDLRFRKVSGSSPRGSPC